MTLRDFVNTVSGQMSHNEHAVKDYSREFELPVQGNVRAPREQETDPHKLAQRQKQIDFGKNTLGYARYCKEVPRGQRKAEHPTTPDKRKMCSKRSFNGMISKWRRQLHEWDPVGDSNVAAPIPTALPLPPQQLPLPPPLPPLPPGREGGAQLNSGWAGADSAAGLQARASSGGVAGCPLMPLPASGSKRRFDQLQGEGQQGSHSEGTTKSARTTAYASPAQAESSVAAGIGAASTAADDIYGDWEDDIQASNEDFGDDVQL